MAAQSSGTDSRIDESKMTARVAIHSILSGFLLSFRGFA
jgi:hypothetical protein